MACIKDGKCLACEHFGTCDYYQKKQFEHQKLAELKNTLWGKCKHKNHEKYCAVCPDLKECLSQRNLPYRHFSNRNVVINVFPDNDRIEVLHYKTPFLYLDDSENLETVDRKHMLQLNAQGIYEPVSDDFTIKGLQRSIRNANKRSLDSFYGFARSNDWEYFITLTFSPEHVDRYDDIAVKALWAEFQRWCVRRSPNVKILVVPERHKDGAIHFHGLMSNIIFSLTPATDNRTGKLLCSKCGSPLFNINDWTFGLSTLAVIPKDDNYEKVCNYMQKYVCKDGNIGYCKKRYYRTRNLIFKNKSLIYCSEEELDELVESLGLEAQKDNDKMTVYRKKADISE